jgi:hypothetical protein
MSTYGGLRERVDRKSTFMDVGADRKQMNQAMKSVVAGFVGGIVAPLSAAQIEPARRLNIDAIKRASVSPEQAWKTVGAHLKEAMRANGSSGRKQTS